MRRYYLFNIRRDFYNEYYNREEVIYNTLEKLYYLNDNKDYGVSIFLQLCHLYSSDIIKHYIIEKYKPWCHSNKCLIINNQTVIEINPSALVVLNKSSFPQFISILKFYSKTIFVCDFKNRDYFWLDKYK